MPSRTTPPPRRRTVLGLSPRAWIAIAIAFIAGLLLFALIWTRQRRDDAFFHADGPQRSASGRELDPLPVPDTGRIAAQTPPADSGNDKRGQEDGQSGPLEELPSPPPVQTPPPPMRAAADVQNPATPADSPPVPVSNPPPRYPPSALRRGESGEVLLRVHVGIDGVPMQIDLIDGSGSGQLDRAATQAVQAWRFHPALRDGRPVVGVVQVPIAFNARR